MAIKNWILGFEPELKNVDVKIRHGATRYSCLVTQNQDQCLRVKIHKQDQGIAAGQFAVFYKEQECLGGGVIL